MTDNMPALSKHARRGRFRWNVALLPEWVFAIVAMIAGICFVVLLPAGVGLDEPAHIARASTIAEGNLIADLIPDKKGYTSDLDIDGVDAALYGGYVDSALFTVAMENTNRFYQPKDETGGQRLYDFPTWETQEVVSDLHVGESLELEAYSNTAVNSPFAYAPYIFGYWVAKIFTSNAYMVILTMRLFGLLFSIAVVFLCIREIPIGKWILATVSLIPINVISMSSVTADTVTYAGCVAYITAVLRFALQNKRLNCRQWIVLSLLTICLALIKLSYLPLLILLILIPVYNRETRDWLSLIRGCAIAAATCIVFMMWYSVISGINTGTMFPVGASPTLQKQFILSNPLEYLGLLVRQLFSNDYFSLGVFGALDAHGHWEYSGWITVLAICLSVMMKDDREYGANVLRSHAVPYAVVCLSVAVCVFVLVETALYLQYNPVGADDIDGVQTRYFLPILALVLSPLTVLQQRGDESQRRWPTAAVARRPANVMAAFQLLSAFAMLYVLYSSLYVCD